MTAIRPSSYEELRDWYARCGGACTAPRRPAKNPDEYERAFGSCAWVLDDDMPGGIRRVSGGNFPCDPGPEWDPATPPAAPVR